MSEERVIEIKINDFTYIVSEANKNDDHLKQIIKDILIEILKYEQKNNKMIKYRCLVLCFILQGDNFKDNKIYNTDLYCRLSLDDGSVGESGSIQTQKIILEEYAKIHGFKIYDVYVVYGGQVFKMRFNYFTIYF